MNTFSSEISQRYALALYDLSKENNQTEEFVANIKEFMKVFNSNESLRFFIKNPTYSVEDQKSVFNKILAQMNMNKIVKNFFSLLIIKKRIFFVDQIAEKFLNIISIKKGELSLNIVSGNLSRLLIDLETNSLVFCLHSLKISYLFKILIAFLKSLGS